MSLIVFLQSVLGYLVPFLFVLTTVVFFHELGHFLVGRWCGVKVDAFSLGFGPEIFARVDRKGTRWRLAAIPLGATSSSTATPTQPASSLRPRRQGCPRPNVP